MIELRTLGALELTSADGFPLAAVLAQPRRAAIVCYLALARPCGFQRRDTLYGLFWPDYDADRARHALRQSLYFLRRSLGAGAITARGEELALGPAQLRCDAVEFEHALEQGRTEEALTLYRGELLPSFHISAAPEFERWLDGERRYLAERAAAAAWTLAETLAGEGDAGGASAWGRRAAALSPADETALRRLVLLLDRMGDRIAAIRAYDAFVRDLEREYELVPSEETRALLDRIRAGRNGGEEIRENVPGISLVTPDEARPIVLAPDAVWSTRGARPDDCSPVEVPSPLPPAALPAPPLSAGASRPGVPVRVWASAALVLVLFAAAGWWRTGRPHPAHAPRERIIVGDFTNATTDSSFGELVSHILSAELARSPVLSVIGQAHLAETLGRMRLESASRLQGELAREVAVREEVKLVVDGDVRTIGPSMVIRVSVVEAATGQIIHGVIETVQDSSQILPAIARVSSEIRRSVGESLASVQAGDSLWSFTTSSLPALRKHMAGTHSFRQGNYRSAIQSLEEAVALDPEFAHAHLLLYGLLDHVGLPRGRYLPHLLRAYELRGRLTDRERYAIEGAYHREVTGDIPQAVAAFQKHLEALRQFPVGEGGWYTRYAHTLIQSGDLVRAERILQEARARYPIAINYVLLIEVLYAAGRETEARRVLDEARRRYPDHPQVELATARMLAAAGRVGDAHALAGRVRGDLDLENGLLLQAELDAQQGRVSEAVEHLKELQEGLMARGNRTVALEIAMAAGRLRLLAGDSGGITDLTHLLARDSMDSLDLLSRPYLQLALFYARAGRPREARSWLTAYEQWYPKDLQRPDGRTLNRTRAAVYLAEGHPTEALQELLLAARYPADARGVSADPFLPAGDHPELARVYERMGAIDAAVAVYERYLAALSLRRSAVDAIELAESLERLAQLHEERRNPSRAAAVYRRLHEQLRDSDRALQPRVANARQRTAALEGVGETGH